MSTAHQSDSAPASSTHLLFSPFLRFIHNEASSGILLLCCTVLALVLANSSIAPDYFALWETPLTLGVGTWTITKPLLLLINDGLMAVFFFVVGLEIKRELIAGELSTAKQAALPFAGAFGGMVVPACIYAALNHNTPSHTGWGVPMATDIAFAIGVMVLLGKRIPVGVKVFLTALAIVDDLGAVLVIALFYTSELSLINLGFGMACLGLLILANLAGIRSTLVYAAIGICGLWVAFLLSGVHPTIAGVLAAFTIPARTKLVPGAFVEKVQSSLQRFEEAGDPDEWILHNTVRIRALSSLGRATSLASSPLKTLEEALHPWVVFLIMPIFAFANAGVTIDGSLSDTLFSPVSLGIILGLFLGKQIGITVFAWLAVKMGLASLPANTRWREIYAAACLGGIGFTMSIFIASLAFSDANVLAHSKIAILVASICSAVFGSLVFVLSSRTSSTEEA